MDFPAPICRLHASHFTVKPETDTVGGRVLCKSIGQAEGTDDSASGSVQSSNRVIADVGLKRTQLIPFHNPQTFHTVGKPVLVELLQSRTVFLAHHDY